MPESDTSSVSKKPLIHVDRQSISTSQQPQAHVWLVRRCRKLEGVPGFAHGFIFHALGRRLSIEWWRDV